MPGKFIPLRIDNGSWSSGEPSETPDGYCRSIRNMLLRPNRLDSRPPFVYDSLMSITGLGMFDDQTNKCSRQLSLASDQKLYEKATSGETQSASLGTVGGTRLTGMTNYRGKAYGMMETAGLPAAAFSFDGTNINTTPFNSAIQGRDVVAYLDRIFVIYPRVTVTNLDPNPFFGGGSPGITLITTGSVVTRRFSAVATSATSTLTGYTFSTSTDQFIVLRQDLQAAMQSTQVPLTLRMQLISPPKSNTTAFAVGALVADTVSGSIQRCTVAGTTGIAVPVSATPGTATVDGTVTWVCEYPTFIISAYEFMLPTATEDPNWKTYWLEVKIPRSTNTITLRGDIYIGNSSVPAPVGTLFLNVAQTDGIADGDPRKKTYGAQVTNGDYRFPFVNKESSSTVTVDQSSIAFSDILQPEKIRSSNTYELQESAGYPTTGYLLGGRLLVHKRNAFWIFAGNTDLQSFDLIPIRKEDKKEGIGCIGPKAHDEFINDGYFIGEDDVYHFTVGSDQPEGIGGDAMREEIMSRGSNWVELQATYNQPILRINKREKEVYVYTQKGTIYVYNIARKGWTAIDVTIDGSKIEVADMIFNPNTRKMEVAFGGYGLARLDWSNVAATDIIDNTATGRNVTMEIVTKPLETFAPRLDWLVDNMGVFHLATASQANQTLTASVSTDRGVTFPWSDTVTLDLTNPRNQIDLFESAPSLTLKLSMTGKTGGIVGSTGTPSVWSVSKFDAEVEIIGGEWPQSKPAPQSAVL